MIREYGDLLNVPVLWCCTGINEFHVANHLLQECATSFWQFYDAVLAVFGGCMVLYLFLMDIRGKNPSIVNIHVWGGEFKGR